MSTQFRDLFSLSSVKDGFSLILLSSVLMSFPATAKPVFRCDDYISYAITSTGKCVNLESFTKLADLNRQLVDLNRQITPLIVQKLRITGDDESKIYFIEGEVYNQSKRTIKIGATVTVDVNGFAKEIPVIGVIKPGQRKPFKSLTETRGTPVVLDVTPID